MMETTMRKIDQLLAEYGESHQNSTNKAIHWICVPLIFFSVLGLFASIPAGPVQYLLGDNPYAHWATVFVILGLAYYVTLSIPLAFGMMLFSAMCLYFINVITSQGWTLWVVCLTIFVLAWIGQFYGHKVEGKKPSFLKDLQFLLIGPAWLMHFVFKRMGIPY